MRFSNIMEQLFFIINNSGINSFWSQAEFLVC